jgi:hypothetical protein
LIFFRWSCLISSEPTKKEKQNGGVRPGAGRPKGSISRRVRAINNMTVAALSRVKKVPLETMLKNMERFDEEADAAFLEGDFDCESKAGALQVGWPTDYAVTSFTAVTLSAKDCRTGDTKVIGVQAIRLIVEEAWELRWAQVFFAQSLVLTEEHPGRPGLGGVLVNRVAVVVSKAAWQTNSKTRAWRSFGLWWNPSLVW